MASLFFSTATSYKCLSLVFRNCVPKTQIYTGYAGSQIRARRICSRCAKHQNGLQFSPNVLKLSLRKTQLYSLRHSSSSSHKTVKHESIFPLRFVFVNTSRDLWEECPNGMTFDVGYVDSGINNNLSKSAPVILGIPSSAGTHEELEGSLTSFVKLGYRVLILNMPGTFFVHELVKCRYLYE